MFAIETAVRAGEICQLCSADIDVEAKLAHLRKTKNGDERDVPLSDQALLILQHLPPPPSEKEPLFQLSSSALISLFRKHRLKTRIQDLTFHDTRHEATTRLADKLHVLELTAVTGHRNIKELLTYYNKSASELATKMNALIPAKADASGLDCSNLAQELLRELSKGCQAGLEVLN